MSESTATSQGAGSEDRGIPGLEASLAELQVLLGEEHYSTLGVRVSLAHAYRSAGDQDRAIAHFEVVVAQSLRLLGEDHPLTLAGCRRGLGDNAPETLVSRTNLAGAHFAAGDLGRAIPMLEAILADASRVLGAEHRVTNAVRSNLKAARSSQQRS